MVKFKAHYPDHRDLPVAGVKKLNYAEGLFTVGVFKVGKDWQGKPEYEIEIVHPDGGVGMTTKKFSSVEEAIAGGKVYAIAALDKAREKLVTSLRKKSSKKKQQEPKHSLVAGDKHVSGYEKGDRLTGFQGDQIDKWRRSTSQKSWYLSETDQQYYTQVYSKELRQLDRHGDRVHRYLAGVSMGEGMLFRGETSTAWKTHEEAEEAANAIAEYWVKVDEEDAEKFAEEQRLENAEEMADTQD
jgi:hypothetical protein